MDDMEAAISEWWAGRQNAAHAQAARKATEADGMAEKCATEEEAKQFRAVAQVWREVAENFRRENEELKAKLNGMVGRAKSDFTSELNALDVENIIQQAGDGSLRLVDSGARLARPAPGTGPLNGHGGKPATGATKGGMVPIAELRQIADKLGLGEEIPDESLCDAIKHVLDAIMSDDDELLSDDDEPMPDDDEPEI